MRKNEKKREKSSLIWQKKLMFFSLKKLEFSTKNNNFYSFLTIFLVNLIKIIFRFT